MLFDQYSSNYNQYQGCDLVFILIDLNYIFPD